MGFWTYPNVQGEVRSFTGPFAPARARLVGGHVVRRLPGPREPRGGGVEVHHCEAQGIGERAPHGVVARMVHAADHEIDAFVALAQPHQRMRKGNQRPERATREVEPHAP